MVNNILKEMVEILTEEEDRVVCVISKVIYNLICLTVGKMERNIMKCRKSKVCGARG